MNVNPGIFNKTIYIYQMSNKKNENGYREEDVLLIKTKASIIRMTGKEIATIGTTYSEATTRFFMRYNSKVNTKQYILYNNAKYDIQYINDYADNKKYMEIIALKREVSA